MAIVKDSEAPPTAYILQSENSQAPQENSLAATREEVSFGEVAQTVLVVTEEIFCEPHPVAPSPLSSLVQDPLLSVEDFTVEQAGPAPSEMDFPPM